MRTLTAISAMGKGGDYAQGDLAYNGGKRDGCGR